MDDKPRENKLTVLRAVVQRMVPLAKDFLLGKQPIGIGALSSAVVGYEACVSASDRIGSLHRRGSGVVS